MSARIIPAATVMVALEDVTVDLLCFEQAFAALKDRRMAGRLSGYVEATFAANPGLADHGPLLPRGLRVNLPAFRVEEPDRTPQRLWDDP